MVYRRAHSKPDAPATPLDHCWQVTSNPQMQSRLRQNGALRIAKTIAPPSLEDLADFIDEVGARTHSIKSLQRVFPRARRIRETSKWRNVWCRTNSCSLDKVYALTKASCKSRRQQSRWPHLERFGEACDKVSDAAIASFNTFWNRRKHESRFSKLRCDAVLAVDEPDGTWAAETVVRMLNDACSGKLVPASVTRDALLLVALANSLRSIQKPLADKLVTKQGRRNREF